MAAREFRERRALRTSRALAFRAGVNFGGRPISCLAFGARLRPFRAVTA
jgi:hypothetical protein